jgi:hypothetical protein
MAYTEDVLTQSAQKNGIGLIKVGNSNQYSQYAYYKKKHPNSKSGGLTSLKPAGLSYDYNSFPSSVADRSAREKEFKAKRAAWKGQFLGYLKKLDKTKPLVLYFGNHGLNANRKDPKDSSAICMFSEPSSMSQCLSYEEFGDLLVEAGLTGPKAPPLRIVGDHCYGGGVHHLAMRFSNVCSASSVGYSNVQGAGDSFILDPEKAYGGEESMAPFGATFWNTVKQEGVSGTSLANSFQAAWAMIPKDEQNVEKRSFHSGGTLSSVFYAQKIMGWSDDELPTDDRLPSLVALEKNLNSAKALFARTQTELENFNTLDQLESPQIACKPKDREVSHQAQKLEPLVKFLTLDQGANIYRDAVDKVKDRKFIERGKANVAALSECWNTAKAKYKNADARVKKYIDENGNWAWKNFFRSEKDVRAENKKAQLNAAETLGNQVLKDLEKCIETRQPAAREYLTTLQTLETLEKLGSFAEKATPAQKEAFRKKVECESAPLL